MLSFREIDYNKDLDQIIYLIKKNLDPDFSLELFKWKHLENPFGKSYGLLALDDEQIVGLRMFMFWEFSDTQCNEKIRAIRPVDTVVDKSQRGKGLFKKLTLQGLEECQNRYEIVFNTPNDNSLPGYLKMGWRKIENIHNFKIGMINPFVKSLKFKTSSVHEISENGCPQKLSLSSTFANVEFLVWRYKNKDYKLATFQFPGHYLIYKKSKLNGLPALIIYEIIGKPEFIGKMMNSLGKNRRVPLIYFYGNDFSNKSFLKGFDRNKPVVVYKDDIKNMNTNLKFSLGDLEGKL